MQLGVHLPEALFRYPTEMVAEFKSRDNHPVLEELIAIVARTATTIAMSTMTMNYQKNSNTWTRNSSKKFKTKLWRVAILSPLMILLV